MSGVLERTLAILELLTVHPEGVPLRTIAEKLNIPASAAHRLVTEMVERGYVRQVRDQGDYGLTGKLVAMVLDYMGAAGIVDFAQPILDRLAEVSGEFIRLAVVDGDSLTYVARAQGARGGLRYDPQVDAVAQLSCTATGQSWLMTMSDGEALDLIMKQGFGRPEAFGPNAPLTAAAMMKLLSQARARGYALTVDMFGAGLSSMAMPVRRPGEAPVGALSIAGPSVRLTPQRMQQLAPELARAVHDIALASVSSPLFASRRSASEAQHTARPQPQRKVRLTQSNVGQRLTAARRV